MSGNVGLDEPALCMKGTALKAHVNVPVDSTNLAVRTGIVQPSSD